MYDSVTDGLSLTSAPYISLPFEFRSHLLLAADGRGCHGVRAHARGRHQGGGAVQAHSRQHQHRNSEFPSFTGRPAVRTCRPRGQRLDHQKWQKVCIRESVKLFWIILWFQLIEEQKQHRQETSKYNRATSINSVYQFSCPVFFNLLLNLISKLLIPHTVYSLHPICVISHLCGCLKYWACEYFRHHVRDLRDPR